MRTNIQKNEIPSEGRAQETHYPSSTDLEKEFDSQFESTDGELISQPYSVNGYSFSAKRRKVSPKGHIITRFTLTYPDGTLERILQDGPRMRSGCHSAADWDYCGCKECKEIYKPVVFQITGDNMLPYLKIDDKVLCLHVQPGVWESIKDERVVIKIGDDYLLGRIDANDLETNGSLTLYTDNSDYAPEVFSRSDIAEMWKISEVLGTKNRYPWPHRYSQNI